METKIKQIAQDIWDKKIILLVALLTTIVGAGYSTEFDNLYWRFIIVIFAVSLVAIAVINKKVEWASFAIIMSFGTFFVIFSPVFDVLDEPAHYARAQHISEGNFFLQNDEATLGFSKDYQYLAEEMEYNGVNRFDPKKNFFHTDLFSKKHNPEKQIETKIKATRTYGSLMYFPGAFGLWFGKLISNGNLGVMFYLGRFLNLLMYALMAFFAIKMAGRWKLLVGFFAIQHLPIYISASFNQDAFFYGLSLLIFAKLIQLFDREEPIDYRDVIEMTIYAGMMTFTKLPNIMLIGLMLFIPLKRYKSKKVYFSNFIGIGFVIAIALIWLNYYSKMEATDLPKSVNQGEQLAFMLENPKQFIQALLAGVMSTVLKFKQYFTFGWSFHYSELAHMLSLPLLGVMLMMYPVKLKHTVNGWFKTAICGVSLAIITLTNIILYLTFTGVGETVIKGVQGRYFYGLLILMPFVLNLAPKVFAGVGLEQKEYFDEKKFERIILFLSLLILIWMATMRIGAYY